MKIREKILILSLLPVTLVTAESILFTNFYLKDYPEAKSIMLFPLIKIGGITLVITFVVVYLVATILTKSIKNVSFYPPKTNRVYYNIEKIKAQGKSGRKSCIRQGKSVKLQK